MATATVPTHRVGKPFDGFGRRFRSGELVDATDWDAGRVRQLAEQRYLQPLKPQEVVALAGGKTSGT